MKNGTSQKIINYLKKNKQASGAELADFLSISDRAVRKQLKNLLNKGIIYKIGKPPKVFYLIKEKNITQAIDSFVSFDKNKIKTIEENYLIITPGGERKEGLDGFIYWCNKK